MARNFTIDEAQYIGNDLGIDFTAIPLEQFRRGLAIELEHGTVHPETNITDDDLRRTGKIAWAHLLELPDYYDRLAAMERAAGS